MTKTAMDSLVWKNFLVTTGGIRVSSRGRRGRGGGSGIEGKLKDHLVG